MKLCTFIYRRRHRWVMCGAPAKTCNQTLRCVDHFAAVCS